MNMDNQLDMISFGIIANSGDARSYAFQALTAAKQGEFEEADNLIQKASEAAEKAHKAQTDLLFDEMNGEHKSVNVLLVHSQDHLMNAMLAIELITEMIDILKRQAEKEGSREQKPEEKAADEKKDENEEEKKSGKEE